MTPFTQFYKAPTDVLDYGINFANWLSTGDVIVSVAWKVDRGLVEVSSSNTDTVALITLRGGVLDHSYTVTAQATLQSTQIKSWSFQVNVQQT